MVRCAVGLWLQGLSPGGMRLSFRYKYDGLADFEDGARDENFCFLRRGKVAGEWAESRVGKRGRMGLYVERYNICSC